VGWWVYVEAAAMIINGVEKPTERVHIVSASEPWGEVLLDDGTVIRLRLCVLAVHKVIGETAPDGAPLYQIVSTNLMNAVPPTR
jgi:hypothetical protein